MSVRTDTSLLRIANLFWWVFVLLLPVECVFWWVKWSFRATLAILTADMIGSFELSGPLESLLGIAIKIGLCIAHDCNGFTCEDLHKSLCMELCLWQCLTEVKFGN